MTASSHLQGVLAPVLTPMHDDLSPDTAKWIAFCQQLLADGCTGLAPFGTTSEANSLALDERMEMLAALVESGVPAHVLMPGAGMCATPDAAKLAAQAAKLGCGGVLLLPPFYYKGVSDEGLYRSVADVIQRVGDSRLRVYLYHIPPIAQVGYSVELVGRLLRDYPETVVGMKDSSGDWSYLERILAEYPGFGTFAGSEKFLLATLRAGGAGTITAMANVIPAQLRELYDHWQDDNADQLQSNANVMRDAMRAYAPIPGLKQVMADRTGDAAWRNIRPPLMALTPAQTETLRTALAQ